MAMQSWDPTALTVCYGTIFTLNNLCMVPCNSCPRSLLDFVQNVNFSAHNSFPFSMLWAVCIEVTIIAVPKFPLVIFAATAKTATLFFPFMHNAEMSYSRFQWLPKKHKDANQTRLQSVWFNKTFPFYIYACIYIYIYMHVDWSRP